MAHRKTRRPRHSTPTGTRDFAEGDRVRIAGKSIVVDRERAMEGLPPEERVPIEQDVTGLEGEIVSGAAPSRSKDGELCHAVRVRNGACVIVPERRLERVAQEGDTVSFSMPREAWERIFGRNGGRRRPNGTRGPCRRKK